MKFAARARQLDRLEAKLLAIDSALPSLRTIEACDFVTGGRAGFGRAADHRGVLIQSWRAREGESLNTFRHDVKAEARRLGVRHLVFGGLPRVEDSDRKISEPAPAGAIAMPDRSLHGGQVEALRVIQGHRFAALRCGRRFGKSALVAAIAVDTALLGGMAGAFAPTFRLAGPLFDVIHTVLRPLVDTSNRSSGELRLIGGGGVDVWSLEHGRAGRGRRYNTVALDEAAHGDDSLNEIWAASIRPTLMDVRGTAIAASTPNGISETNFFWRACTQPELGFTEFVAPTGANPIIPMAELELLQREHAPLIYSQEVLAQFVSLSGAGLFDVRKMLREDGTPWPLPPRVDVAVAALDSGIKGGVTHDASAVVYLALSMYPYPPRVYVCDWESSEVGAGGLEGWFEDVITKHMKFGARAHQGAWPIYIENQALGELLLAKYPQYTQEIPAARVALGKDLRALAAERHINGGRVRMTAPAFDKVSRLKGVVRNHLVSQLSGFRIGDRDAWKRSDDLVDALVYGVLQSFGE